MKILSVAIPSYNSQDYMRKCIESLLPGGDDIEIIIVNDGSKDHTGEIAEEICLQISWHCEGSASGKRRTRRSR